MIGAVGKLFGELLTIRPVEPRLIFECLVNDLDSTMREKENCLKSAVERQHIFEERQVRTYKTEHSESVIYVQEFAARLQ